MENLIFLAIAVVVIIVQKLASKSEDQQSTPPQRTAQNDEPQENKTPRSLQDLIRQFEEAQRQAAQGNIEPPTPPATRHSHQTGAPLSLRDIAEVVIEEEFINLEFLMEVFEVDKNEASRILEALQKHRIVGRDMGEGDCDVLIHDLDELENLINREKRAEAERQKALEREELEQRRRDEEEYARQQELERQRELNALEERAKSARESAAEFMGANISDTGSQKTNSVTRKPAVSTKNIADVRKGFIWAKVLDEPRFKRRWSAQYR